MPKKGSGVTSLDELKNRCVINEFSGCWHWRGAMIGGHPRVWMMDPLKGSATSLSGPRALAFLTGKRMKNGWRAWMTCQHKDCMCPDHLMTGTTKRWGRWVAENDIFKGSPKRRAALLARWSKELPGNKEKALIVRASDETGRALSKRLELSRSVISRMRRGISWQGPVTPFSGLGART